MSANKSSSPPEPISPSDKKSGCAHAIVVALPLVALLLAVGTVTIGVLYLQDPDVVSQSWVGPAVTWLTATALAFWQWLTATALAAWIAANLGLILLGVVCLAVLVGIASVCTDVAGSDDKGCVLVVLCLCFPPLLILMVLIWCLKPSEDS